MHEEVDAGDKAVQEEEKQARQVFTYSAIYLIMSLRLLLIIIIISALTYHRLPGLGSTKRPLWPMRAKKLHSTRRLKPNPRRNPEPTHPKIFPSRPHLAQ